MGQGVQIEKRGAKSKDDSGPAQAITFFNLQLLFEKRARLLYNMPTPDSLIFWQNLKHETCREFNHESNHIKH